MTEKILSDLYGAPSLERETLILTQKILIRLKKKWTISHIARLVPSMQKCQGEVIMIYENLHPLIINHWC